MVDKLTRDMKASETENLEGDTCPTLDKEDPTGLMFWARTTRQIMMDTGKTLSLQSLHCAMNIKEICLLQPIPNLEANHSLLILIPRPSPSLANHTPQSKEEGSNDLAYSELFQ